MTDAVTRFPGQGLEKAPSGINGLDEITDGGLPRGRTILVCGGPGCGKTLMAMEFLVKGVLEHDEPGVFISFEETAEELAANVDSLGWDLEKLTRDKKFFIDHVQVERSEIEETGEYDLDALFIRLSYAVDRVGAKRIVLDTVESLFGSLPNEPVLRSELRRLFHWLKEKGVTAIITGERGEKTLTRYGLEEYVSDCVIDLKHEVHGEITNRRLRIVKYRGSRYATNVFPFLIEDSGISILPVTSISLDYEVSNERISTGVPGLDRMFDGGGVHRGTGVLVSGTSGSGKTSLGGMFASAACNRGERCMFFAFEESPDQIVRNLGAIGVDLQAHLDSGQLRFVAERPSAYVLERHLLVMHRLVEDFQPSCVVVDPISSFLSAGSEIEVKSLMNRFVDFLKNQGISFLFTDLDSDLTHSKAHSEASSIMDTMIILRNLEVNGERIRDLYILKSRGTQHSNQVREFIISGSGIELQDITLGPQGVLTGSARRASDLQQKADSGTGVREAGDRPRYIEQKLGALKSQIEALESELKSEHNALELAVRRSSAPGSDANT